MTYQHLLNEVFEIDYQTEGEQWLHHLTSSLSAGFESPTGYGISVEEPSESFPFNHYKLTIESKGVVTLPVIRILPLNIDGRPKGVRIILSSNTELVAREIQAINRSINNAIKSLQDESPVFPWSGAISKMNFSGEHYIPDKVYSINGVTIRPGNKEYYGEMNLDTSPSFSNYNISNSYPIIIEGCSRGYNWSAANVDALSQAYSMVSILSLVWGSSLTLIDAPRMMEPGVLTVPPKLPGLRARMWNNSSPIARPIPNWMGKAIQTLKGDVALSSALDVYYQGLKLEVNHPSFSLVAFTAVIESIGGIILRSQEGDEVKKFGAKQKFRAGLKAVSSDDIEYSKLLNSYTSRSATVHEGALHGSDESNGNAYLMSIFAPQKASIFIMGELQLLKKAASRLLLSRLN